MVNIYFFIGTKAQAIKCLPVIKEFKSFKNYTIYLINSGQHVETLEYILNKVSNSVIKIDVFENDKNISTFKQSYKWFISFVFNHLIRKPTYHKQIASGICFVHGDTVSTLLGLLWAKKNKLKVLHLESGLTSKKLLKPFPEEIIRRVVSRFSDILICFDEESDKYLKNKFGSSKKTIKRISENTLLDSLQNNVEIVSEKKITVTLHRVENLISKKVLKNFVNFLARLSDEFVIKWYLHEPTKNFIQKHNIKIPKLVNTYDLLEHDKFLIEIASSSLVITDGGSIQEECYFLGKKTVIWRETTEREYALNNNMFISNFNTDLALEFINSNFDEVDNKKLFKNKPSLELIHFLNEINEIK